jgi:hypothetical protein
MGKYGQRLCLAMLPLQFLTVLSGLQVSSEEQDGSFGECPFQVNITNLLS